MMKNIVIPIIAIAFTMCSTTHKDKKIITGFLEQMVLNGSYDIKNVNQYIDISKNITDQKREGIYKLLEAEITALREKLKHNSTSYKIIPHDSVKYSDLIRDYGLNYDSYDNVYYLVNDDQIITFFIMNNGKIRSFFPGITKKAGEKNPLMLNIE